MTLINRIYVLFGEKLKINYVNIKKKKKKFLSDYSCRKKGNCKYGTSTVHALYFIWFVLGTLYVFLSIFDKDGMKNVSDLVIIQRYNRCLAEFESVRNIFNWNVFTHVFEKMKNIDILFEDDEEDTYKNEKTILSKINVKEKWNKYRPRSNKIKRALTKIELKDNLNRFIKCLNKDRLEIVNDYNSDRSYDDIINEEENNINNLNSKYIYNWNLGKKSLCKMLENADNYYINGVKYSDWKLTSIPTHGYNKEGGRVQEMFKTFVSSKEGDGSDRVGLFIKKIPVHIWVKQFELMNAYNGEYVLCGENYVMEATTLAFLNEYYPGITPKLYKILYEPEKKEYDIEQNTPDCMFRDLNVFNDILSARLKCNMNGYIVIISELFGEDIYTYLRKQKKKNIFALHSYMKRKKILFECLNVLRKLHDAGLCHLDISPQNILMSYNFEIRLCDLAKSTPIYTNNLRHLKNMNGLYLFESCVPTIGKIRSMPPECWKISRKYIKMKICEPLEQLAPITNLEERAPFYFDVTSADKFMLGVLFIWIWNNDYLWKRSDIEQDIDFLRVSECDMNIDVFELTRTWPYELKKIIQKLLQTEGRKNLNLHELCAHPWWFSKM
ncbi:serine/threonine protein kinase, FIKK family [Plasmodium reichenowi]|uniref:non-specific serine/threonine protein kinase n=2 Tax=Plasmodium reichenowi TaxID=5854 RepID=A0A060RYE4_PLARE|nr:serine/threonine protein kinase, FIKK family [Plasmodium reichenowi]KYN97617.1 serine/threonine protein kinase, FIKK family [Plasmodium reichenowi]CDO64595.1 serine/threonine protein kinase, FIKK family [Plasmodium reichenowi]